MSEAPLPEPLPPPGAPLWRRIGTRIRQLHRPLLVLAGVGTVLGGLAGYWNAWRAARDASSAVTAPQAAPVAEAGARSIAVLPFASLGDEAGDAAFAAGVGEELVHVLSRVRGLRVTARRSALQFKDKALPMAEMARQLQVAYLVDGSVRRTGGRVRIGAQLVEGRSGAVLWSGQFERDLKDAMAAQGDLALQIAQQLRLPLDGATLEGSGTKNTQAWQLFMQAQRLPRGTGQREPLYRQALALDPAFSRVHVELAEEELNKPWASRDGPAVGAKIVAHLETALRIDPRSAFAHGRLATAAALRNDLEAMRRHARKALELDPGDMPGLNWSSELELAEVRVANAIALRRQMVEMEPLDALARLFLAQRLFWAQQPQEALEVVDRALLLRPGWPDAEVERAMILLALGRHDEALALARAHNWVEVFGLAGSSEDLAALRQRTGLGEHRLAALAFFEGRYEAFFDHFEQDHSSFMHRNRALFDPALDRVRGHPRFKAWLARYGMEQAHERAQAWRAANPPPPR